jgi:hypothetical protein
VPELLVYQTDDATTAATFEFRSRERMAPNIQDHVIDEVEVTRTGDNHRNPTERYVFRTIESIGARGENNEWRQRIASIIIAVVICTALYGVLYLAMHFQD